MFPSRWISVSEVTHLYHQSGGKVLSSLHIYHYCLCHAKVFLPTGKLKRFFFFSLFLSLYERKVCCARSISLFSAQLNITSGSTLLENRRVEWKWLTTGWFVNNPEAQTEYKQLWWEDYLWIGLEFHTSNHNTACSPGLYAVNMSRVRHVGLDWRGITNTLLRKTPASWGVCPVWCRYTVELLTFDEHDENI